MSGDVAIDLTSSANTQVDAPATKTAIHGWTSDARKLVKIWAGQTALNRKAHQRSADQMSTQSTRMKIIAAVFGSLATLVSFLNTSFGSEPIVNIILNVIAGIFAAISTLVGIILALLNLDEDAEKNRQTAIQYANVCNEAQTVLVEEDENNLPQATDFLRRMKDLTHLIQLFGPSLEEDGNADLPSILLLHGINKTGESTSRAIPGDNNVNSDLAGIFDHDDDEVDSPQVRRKKRAAMVQAIQDDALNIKRRQEELAIEERELRELTGMITRANGATIRPGKTATVSAPAISSSAEHPEPLKVPAATVPKIERLHYAYPPVAHKAEVEQATAYPPRVATTIPVPRRKVDSVQPEPIPIAQPPQLAQPTQSAQPLQQITQQPTKVVQSSHMDSPPMEPLHRAQNPLMKYPPPMSKLMDHSESMEDEDEWEYITEEDSSEHGVTAAAKAQSSGSNSSRHSGESPKDGNSGENIIPISRSSLRESIFDNNRNNSGSNSGDNSNNSGSNSGDSPKNNSPTKEFQEMHRLQDNIIPDHGALSLGGASDIATQPDESSGPRINRKKNTPASMLARGVKKLSINPTILQAEIERRKEKLIRDRQLLEERKKNNASMKKQYDQNRRDEMTRRTSVQGNFPPPRRVSQRAEDSPPPTLIRHTSNSAPMSPKKTDVLERIKEALTPTPKQPADMAEEVKNSQREKIEAIRQMCGDDQLEFDCML